MSQTGKFRKKARKMEELQERYAYSVLASKVLLGLALGCFVAIPSGVAYANAPANTEIKVKGADAGIAAEADGTYKIYAQFVKDDLGVNRFDKFVLENGNRADMFFNKQGENNYAAHLVNLVNSQVTINGVLNAVKNGKIDGNLYFLSPDGIAIGAQGVINAGSFTGMVVDKDAFSEFYEGTENRKKATGDQQQGAEFDLDAVKGLAIGGTIDVSGHINTHSGIFLGAGVINIKDGAQLKSVSNIQFEDIVNSSIAQQVPANLTATTGEGSDIVLAAASSVGVDDSSLPELKAVKKKNEQGQETDEYVLENWDKWEKGWLEEIFAATNEAAIDNQGKLITDKAVKLTAKAATSYKEGAIFKYLQDQQVKDLVQNEIHKSIGKKAALKTGMWAFLKATNSEAAASAEPSTEEWTKWIDVFLVGIMEGTGNRTNTANISLGGEVSAASLSAEATANLAMNVDASIMARAYTNVKGKNTADIEVKEGLNLGSNIRDITLNSAANTDISAVARGLNVKRADGDTTTKLPSVYGAVTIVNTESGANVKVDKAIAASGDFKATADMKEKMNVVASSAMNEDTGTVSAGVAYVDDKTDATVMLNKDITAKTITADAQNRVQKDLLTVNNTLGVVSGQVFKNDTKPIELKPLDESKKNTLNKYLDKLVDMGDGLVGKLKQYGDAGATVGVFNQENNSKVMVNSALTASGGDLKLNAETVIGDMGKDANNNPTPIGGFHMNVVSSMTHAKSDGSANNGALINAGVLVDDVRNNAVVQVAAPEKKLQATGNVDIHAQAHMDYAPEAEGLYNVKKAWQDVKTSFEAIRDLVSDDVKNVFDGIGDSFDKVDWSNLSSIPSSFTQGEKLTQAIAKIKQDGQIAAKIKERFLTTVDKAVNLTHPSSYTHYHVRTESKNTTGNFTATGSVQVDKLENNAAVLIGEGTSLHADGSTSIKADSGTYTVSLTGKGGEYATLDQEGKVGVGASVAYQEIGGTGLVMVGKDAVIEGQKVDITADQTMKQVDIVYSSGKADTLNIGGMVNIVKGAGNSIVSIDDEAVINAAAADGAIKLHADNSTTINAITGGLTLGGKNASGAVGIGVSWVDYDTNDIVQVADNGRGVAKAAETDTDTDEQKAAKRTGNRSVLARDLAKQIGAAGDDFFGAATAGNAGRKAWQANSFEALAVTTGTINSIGAEIAGTTGSDKSFFDKGSNLIENIGKKRDKFNNWLKGNKLTKAIQGSNASNTASANVGGTGGFKLSAAGSAAINKGNSDTTAAVSGIELRKNSAAELASVTVKAQDDMFIGAFAGGAAFNALKQNNSPAVAIGGAVGYTRQNRTVDSLLLNAQVEGAGTLANQAEKAGTEVAAGLSLAVNTSSGTNLTASGSVSYNDVHNQVRALQIGTDVNKTHAGSTKTVVTNKALASDWQIAGGLSANWTGSDGTSANLGGAVTVSDLSNDVVSMISAGNYKQVDTLSMEAAKSINQINVAVAGSKSGGKTALGLDGAVAYNEVDNKVRTVVRNGAAVEASGAVALVAHDKAEDKTASKADLQAKGIDVDHMIESYISQDAKKTIANKEVVDSANDKEINATTDNAGIAVPGSSLAVNVAAGINISGNGAGAGVGIDEIKNNLSVDIQGATLKAAAIDAGTTNHTKIVGVAAGASIGSEYFGGAGAVSWHNVTNNNTVNITDSNLTADAVNGVSNNQSSIVSVAGQFNQSSNVGAGMTLANNDMNNTSGVYLKGGEIQGVTDGKLENLTLDAHNDTYVLAVGAGVGASGLVGLNGSVAINEGSNSSEAIIGKGTKGTDIVQVKALKVAADNTTSKTTIAGSLTYTNGGIAGIGGGVAYANIGRTDNREKTQALIQDASITTQPAAAIDVTALDTSKAVSVGVGVGIEGSVNLQGGVARTNVRKDVNAGMENTAIDEGQDAAQADVSIKAASTVNNKTAGAALATAFTGLVAGGVGLSFNDVEQNTRAYYGYLNTRPENASRVNELAINATADNKLLGIGIGLAGASTFAVGGSYSYNYIRGNTTAEMNKANIISAQNIGVVSQSDDAISAIAGVIAGGAGGAAGVSVANNQLTGDTVAAVTGSRLVTNTAANSDDAKKIAVNNGIKDAKTDAEGRGLIQGQVQKATFVPGKLKEGRENTSLTGLVIDSSATHAIASDLLTGAGGAIGGVAGTFNENFIEGKTRASLNDTSVNEDKSQYGGSIKDTQNTTVKAADYTNIGAFEVGAAGGANVGFGATQNANNLSRKVLAESYSQSAADVKAHDFKLQALAKQGVSNLAIAGGLAVTGAAANANVISDDLDMDVQARTNRLNLEFANKADILADNESRIYMGTYGASVAGIGASVGMGINLVDQQSTVKTTVANSTLKETEKTTSQAKIEARNKTIQEASLVSGAGAGMGVGIVGTFNHSKLTSDVGVVISGSTLQAGKIDVNSHDVIWSDQGTGSVSGGLFGGVGVNSTVNTVADKSYVNISGNSLLKAKDTVKVKADIVRDIDTFMLNVSLGGVSVGVNHMNTSVNESLKADTALQDKISKANALDKDNTGSFVGLTNAERQQARERTAFQIDTNVAGTSLGSQLSVNGSAIHAGGALSLDAEEKNRLSLSTIGTSVGAGSFVVTNAEATLKNATAVSLDGAGLTGSRVDVTANTTDNPRDDDSAGKTGLYTQGAVGNLGVLGITAITSQAKLTGSTTVNVKNTDITSTGDVNINAKSGVTANTNVNGVTAGVATVNAIDTGITNTSVLAVNFENNSGTHTIKSTKADGKINVNAVNTGNFTANSTGISAGLLAAGGNKTYAKDNSTSQINITGSNYAFAADALSFQAANAPKLKVDIDNHAVGVATGMASYATAEVNSSALINADDNNAFQAGSVYFGAQVGKAGEITAASRLRSMAVAGMAIPGYSGDDSLVSTKTNAAINIGQENYKFTDSENKEKRAALTVEAVNQASRQNDVSNVTVSAIKFAAGAIQGTTRAEDTASANAGGGDVYKLLLGAMVDSYTDSYVRGSGGGIADYGNTAKAVTYFDNAANANIYGKWNVTDDVQLLAQQNDGMDVQAFSGTGGLLQGSGLYTSLDIGSKKRITSANIGNNADIQANKVYVGAENYLNTRKSNKYGKRLDMTAGTLLGMSVLESKDVIRKGTQVNIGDNAKVTTVGTQEYEVANRDVLNNYAQGLNAGLAQTIVTQSRTDYTSVNKVNLGQGAVLRNTGGYDKGGITLAAYDDIDSTVHAEGQVAGLAGAGPTALTEHNIRRTNLVDVKGSIKSQKDINLYAGADKDGKVSTVKQQTIADARNDTLIPMGWRRNLDVENHRTNTVQVEAGAVGEALRNINIKAVNGQEDILKQASYHTIYSGKGGDEKPIPVVESSDGSGRVDKFVAETTNYAQVDGSLLAGYQDKLYVTINGQVVPQGYLGQHEVKNAGETAVMETHEVTAAGSDAAFTISIVDDEGRHYTELEQATKQYSGSYANILAKRWQELKDLLSAYSGNDGKGGDGQTAIAYAGYAAELELLEAKMKNLGLLEEAEINGRKVNIPVTSGYDIPIVALPELLEASGGTINVDSNNFYGKGSVVAKTNPEVKVENKSNAYLVVNDVLLRDKGDGIVYRDTLISSDAAGKAQIKNLNVNKNYGVTYSKLKSVSGDGPAVTITSDNDSISGITLTDRVTKDGQTNTVTSTFEGVGGIEIAGHVNGGIGDVNITNRNRKGDIIINGSDSKATGVDGRTIRLTAASGSVTQSYTKGVVHIGSTPEDVYKTTNDAAITNINNGWGNSYTEPKHTTTTVDGSNARSESESTATKAGRIAGNAIFIAADAINVNGILQSGYGKYAAVVTEEQVAAAKTAAANKDFSKSKLYEGHRIYKVNEGGTSWDNKDTDGSLKYTVQVYYDPDNDTLLTEDIDAQGGRVYLTGRIISTTGGQIFAVDGGADIQIENQSDTAMQVGKILNNDINGEVVLTTSSMENGKEVLTRHSYTTDKVTTTTGYMGADPQETSDTVNTGRSYSYTPAANSRYNWTVGSDSTTTIHYYYRDTKIFNADVFSFESDSSKVVKTEYPAETKPLPNGIFVSQPQTGSGDYQIVADNVILSEMDRLNFKATSKNYVLWKNYYYNWDKKKGSMQTYVSSIKADNPIAIKFIGQDDGTINVQSRGGITLAGNIRNNNAAGIIDISSAQGGILGNAGVSVIGNKVNLNAQKDVANINIEALDKAKAVQLQANTKDGNIGIALTGDVEISTVKAQADASVAGSNNINLNVSGNILQGAGEGLIGQRIDMTSHAGAIGTSAQMLKVRAGQQALNDDPRSASVNAVAQKDIFLQQHNADENAGGDMRIGIVRSVAGDVTLNNAGGSFVDALPYSGDEASEETTARIQRWIDAGMIAGPDRNNAYIRKLERNVTDYEEMVRKNFADYLVMKENQAGLTDKNKEVYAKLDAEYGAYADSDAYLAYLAADEESDYAKLKAEAANPVYKWTKDELLYALRSEIVNKEVGSTDSRDKIANVSGRNITLIGENVGSNLDPQTIAYEQLANGYVDPNDPGKTNVYYLKILANADAADVIRRQDGQGKDYFEVTGKAPLGIHADGVINAQAVGNDAEDISLSARKAAEDGEASVLKLGTIQADKGSVRIMGKAGLENALADANAANVIAKGEILLEGGEGAVGSEAKAINVQAGGDLTARSNANIYIRNVGENALSVGSVYTPDTLKLWSAKGLVGSTANLDGAVPYINAQNLFLDAADNGIGGDLGTADRPLYILSNGVKIQAAGHSAQFQGVEHDKNSMVLNSVDMSDDLWLHTPGTLTIAAVAHAGDAMDLSADKGIVMADKEEEATAASYLDAGSTLSLVAQAGDLGAKDNALRLLNSGAVVTAAGANGYLLGLERPALHTAGMNLGHIGTETAPGFTGDLWVKSQGALTTKEVVNVKGNLDLLAADDTLISRNDWIAGGNITAKGKTIALDDAVKAGADITLSAAALVDAMGGMTAGKDIGITAADIKLDGNITAKQDLDMEAEAKVTSSGSWTADGNITVRGYDIDTTGDITAGSRLEMAAENQIAGNGNVQAGTDLVNNAKNIKITGGVAAGNNASLLTSAGDIVVSEDVVAKQSVIGLTHNGSFVVLGKVNAIQGDATLITGFDSFHEEDEGSILVTGGISAGRDVTMYSRNADIVVAEFSDNPEANVITAGRDIEIKTIDAGDIAVLGALHSGRNTSALVEGNSGNIEIYDTITAGSSVDLTVQSAGRIFVNFDFDSNNSAENMEVHAGDSVTAHTKAGDIIIGRSIIADQGEINLLSDSGSVVVTGKTNAQAGNILALTNRGNIVIGDTLDHFEESVTAKNNVSLLTNSGTVYIYGKTVAQDGDVSLKAGKDVYEPGKSNFIIEDNGAVEAGHDISLTGRNGDIFIADYLQAKGGVKAYAEEQGNISFATDIVVNGDIGLTTDKGDITVGQNVNSRQGNVDIVAKTGNINIEKDLFAENGAIRVYSGKGEIHIGDQGPQDDVILARTNIDLTAKDGRITVQGRTRSVEGDITAAASVPVYQPGKDSIILEQNGEVVSGGAITINSGNGDFHITDRVQAEESLYTNVIGKGSMYYDTDIEVRNDVKTAVEEGTIYVGSNVKAGNDVDMSSGTGNIYVGHSIDAKTGNINLKVGRGNIDVGDNDAETETITADNEVNIATNVGKITVYGKTSTRKGDITLKAGSENYVAGEDGRNIIIDHNGLVDSARDVKLVATNGDLHVTDNVLSKRNIGAQVLEQGGLYFDRDIDLIGDLAAATENGDIVARDIRATGDITITQKRGDIRLNLADATHVFLQMEDNTEASQVNTIRANANGDAQMDIRLTGSYLKVGTMENKGGASTFRVSVEAPDGQAFIEQLNIGHLRSDTGTFIPKVWTRQGDVYVDKGQLELADVMAADKFRFANAMVDAAVYGRIPTHDGEKLVYWNDAAKAYQMQRPFNLFIDGGMITDRAVLVDSHDWRRLYSRKYSETYSVVDRMRDYLMRKNHYYSAGAFIPYTPPMTYARVELAGDVVNTAQAHNASEQEVTVE